MPEDRPPNTQDLSSPEAAIRLLDSIHRIQLRFIEDAADREAFEALLAILLELTDSDYGFIAETHLSPNGDPFLRTRAVTNIAWNNETRALFERHADEGLEFYNLKTLYGAVLTSRRPVIANAPATDPRRGGLAVDHPPLDAFLGLPLIRGGQLLGMIGLANRAGGYDENVVDYLEPVRTTCSGILHSIQIDRERAAADRALDETRSRLEELLDERTTERDRSRERLIEQDRLAFLGTLTAGLAHQINNPTGAILAASQFALQSTSEVPSEEAVAAYREALKDVEQEAKRCGEIVHGLLAFSHDRTRSLSLVDVRDLAGQIAERVARRFPEAKARIRLEAPARAVMAWTHPLEFEQVITNLLENALTIRPSPSEILIRCAQSADRAHIIVEDDGPGFPPGSHSEIFEPFFTTRLEEGGTGLGLSVAESIIRGQGGTIYATDREGGGARFEIGLGRAPQESGAVNESETV